MTIAVREIEGPLKRSAGGWLSSPTRFTAVP